MSIPINLVFEDELSEFIMSKLLHCFGNKYYTGVSYNGFGNGYIKTNIKGFNEAATGIPFFVLTDLDNNPCAPYVINDWLNKPIRPNLIFRIAIREVESWLLADTEGVAEYFGVSKSLVSATPELLPDPKRALINLAKKCRKRIVREDIIPINENASIGPNYNGRLMEFVFDYWNVNNAMAKSESLRRAYKALDDFQYVSPK
ncbi:MAG: hypothetical protein JST63_06570 [Bacteroidetes bacterium]|nr:hypothetical protein [Bacteroidota bacterium]